MLETCVFGIIESTMLDPIKLRTCMDFFNEKKLAYDNETNKFKGEREELVLRIPLLHKGEVIDTSVKQFCEAARVRFEKCVDFDTKRQFLLDYVEKIIFTDDHVAVYGSVPVHMKAYTDADAPIETSKIEFKLEGDISSVERFATYKKKSGGSPITMAEFNNRIANHLLNNREPIKRSTATVQKNEKK